MNKAYCKCKKCGCEKAEVDMTDCLCLTCNPPIYKYSYKCSECGEIGYAYQEDIYGNTTINTQPLKERLYGHCLICGKQVATNKTKGEVICDECKEAIKWAKEEKKIKETKEIDVTHLDLKEIDKLRHDCWCLGKYEKLEALNSYYGYLTVHDNCLAEENAELRLEIKQLKEQLARKSVGE